MIPGSGPSGDESPAAAVGDALSLFSAGILEKQPFRGYFLKACLAGDDRRAVFKADDKNMERAVAVKVMRPFPGREGAVEEFFSLAGSIARLRCPGVARGLDAGRGDGDFFLAYEFLPGESLAARLVRRQSGRFTEKESLKLVGDIARVLQSLFELGHPHGHLTPANVMLGDGGRVGLADIGFAWSLAWPDDDAAFAAFPDYLPPERIAGDLNVDMRGDLYSLGAIWWTALFGSPIFRDDSSRETLRRHLEEKPGDPRVLDPRLSAATADMLLWLLEKDRDNRPRTPRELLRRLAVHPLSAEPGEGIPPDGVSEPAAEASETEELPDPGQAGDGREAEADVRPE